MKILHVIAAMDPKQGGVSQAVRSIISGLANEGFNSEVVSLDAPNQDFFIDQSLPLIHPLGPAKGPWCYNENLLPWLISNLYGFHGIIIHGLWLYPGYAVKKALQQYTKLQNTDSNAELKLPKLFVMPHGMLDPYFQQAAGRKLKALRNKIYWKLIESKIINNSDAILFTTEEESVLAKGTFYPYRPKAEVVVGLGVEKPPMFTIILKEAFARKCPAIDKSPYLLFLSRIHEKKGLDLLMDAYASVFQEMSDFRNYNSNNQLPKLLIAGPGMETDYGKKIQAIVSASPLLSKNVIFTGMLTGDAKWGAFYGCEAFILPSYQENFGIAVVEALACQKPVLISDKVNIWREIKSTGSGIITSPDLKGVKELLRSWFNLSNERRTEMGTSAHKLFQTGFTVEVASKQLAAVLQ